MTYIIGEIGQNHNGSVKIAKQIIDSATSPIVEQLFNINLSIIDAVKLTKRDLNYELSDSQMAAPYINKTHLETPMENIEPSLSSLTKNIMNSIITQKVKE